MRIPEEVRQVAAAAPDADRKILEGDELRVKTVRANAIHVGPLVITSLAGGKDAGIWIGDGKDRPMVAIFASGKMVGIGVYGDRGDGPCDICLCVDQKGTGYIQFSNAKGELQTFGFDEVKKLCEAQKSPAEGE
jgi:hypothetical protein